VELHSRQEQQRVEEEEAAQMKKLREEQARIAAQYICGVEDYKLVHISNLYFVRSMRDGG